MASSAHRTQHRMAHRHRPDDPARHAGQGRPWHEGQMERWCTISELPRPMRSTHTALDTPQAGSTLGRIASAPS
eukprot:5894737-Prymnesium_polylepis.1